MSRKTWTPAEIEFVANMYPGHSSEHIAHELGRSVQAIYSLAGNMGLKKNAEYLASSYSGRIKKQTEKGVQARFKKGHTPFNKGKKMADYVKPEVIERVMRNSFKKGLIPHNTATNGDVRCRRDKNGHSYMFIRIAKSQWVPLHVYSWERQHGPIAEGCCVVFKTPDRSNCDVTNLELVTREELMRRNTIQQYPEGLRQAMKLIKKLNRTIENGTKQH